MNTRVWGLDLARLLALIGIVYVHTHLGEQESLTEYGRLVYLFGNGVAPALFALLIGLSMKLSWERWQGTFKTYAGHTLVRFAVIGSIGLALGATGSPAAVILFNLAALMLLGLALVRLTARVALVSAIGLTVLGPILSYGLRVKGLVPPFSYENFSQASLAQPLEMLSALTLTGYYPLIFWLSYFLIGQALYYCLGLSKLNLFILTALATSVAVAGKLASVWLLHPAGTPAPPALFGTVRQVELGLYGTPPLGDSAWLLTSLPHGGTIFSLMVMGAWATSVCLLSLILGSFFRSNGVSKALLGAGATSLTLYTLHVLALSSVPVLGAIPDSFELHLAALLLLGGLFSIFNGRGSLESLIGSLSKRLGLREAVSTK